MAAVLLGARASRDAQTSSLVGSVVDRYGVVVARAPVEARNTATGAIYRTFASDQANYELRDFPPESTMSPLTDWVPAIPPRESRCGAGPTFVWTYSWRTARR